MDAKPSMCEFLDSAQLAFDEACIAFADKHNLTDLAKQVGYPSNVMRNMLNPEQPRLLTAPVLFAITKATNDPSIVNALLRGLDVVVAPISSDASESDNVTFVKRVLEHSLSAGDLSRMALEHGGQSRMPRSAKHNIINVAQQGITNLVLLISDLENRTSGMTPFLSMGVDFIANGGAVPGLA